MVDCYVCDKCLKSSYSLDKYDDFFATLHSAQEHGLQINVLFINKNTTINRKIENLDLYLMANNPAIIHGINLIIDYNKLEIRVICKTRAMYVAELCRV